MHYWGVRKNTLKRIIDVCPVLRSWYLSIIETNNINNSKVSSLSVEYVSMVQPIQVQPHTYAVFPS